MQLSKVLAATLCVAFVDGMIMPRPKSTRFLPTSFSLGSAYELDGTAFESFTINRTHPIATLDYGVERAGYPFFIASSIDSPVQIEVKYSESFHPLKHPWSDGPYTFNVALASGFRVETFNVTSASEFSSLLQGGQRWQSIELLSGTSISFESVGFVATVDALEADELPGGFDSDSDLLNGIWTLGAHATSLSCVDKGTQGAVWKVDPEKGIYVQSLRPALSIKNPSLSNITLEFDAFIERAGAWWSVAWPFGRFGGLQLSLVSELPVESTFVNTNTTLTPPNSILLAYGYGFVNQTSLTTYYLDTFKVPFNVAEKTWHRVTTILALNNTLSVLINGIHVFTVPILDYYAGETPIPLQGSFGFGAWQDQAVQYRNVRVTDSANGTLLYENTMTGTDVLSEYGTRSNRAGVCLDGPKRDRLIWLGDFYHTSRILGASTARFDLSKSSFEYWIESQIASGEYNIAPGMGYDPAIGEPFTYGGVTYALEDYQMIGMLALYFYIQQTNDLEFIRDTWSHWQRQIDWLVGKVNVTDGLIYGQTAFLGPAEAGSAVSCAAVKTLRSMGYIAEAVGETAYAAKCITNADGLTSAINTRLWNAQGGFYSLSLADREDLSVASTAFCITSGVSSGNQTMHAIAALDRLKDTLAYKDSSLPAANVYLSPNMNGFLLDALFAAGATARGQDLLENLWGVMYTNDSTRSGASWEYVSPDGSPGLSRFTSLAHPWGGAATYVLTERVAGLRAASGI